MLVTAITASVLLYFLGMGCLYLVADKNYLWSICCGIGYVICLVLATVFYCLHSAKASLACGGLLTALTGILIFIQWFCKDDDRESRLVASVMSIGNIICATAGYLNIYHFLALGISFAILFVLAFINIFTSIAARDSYEKAFSIINIIFAAVLASMCAAGVTGFAVHFTAKREISVEAECSIYKWDVNSQEPKGEVNELYFDEYYAMQIEFEWSDLRALSTETPRVQIKVTFPSKIERPVAEGIEFTKNPTDSKVWTYNFQLNTKTDKQFKSEYFIFNYKYASMELPVKPFNVQINVLKSDGTVDDDCDFFKGYENSYRYDFKKKNYSFNSEDNWIQDLAIADNGYYRIKIPESCKSFVIKIYNNNKSGIYYSETVEVSGEYYLLELPYIFENKLGESIYERIKEKNENLVIEITAVGNDNYANTSIEVLYAIE